jgi:DNA-binding SARP family transcriptional activator
VKLFLLGSFEVRAGDDRVALAMPARRLLGFLALQERPVLRTYAAETLWLDANAERACGSLRSALWRIQQTGLPLIEAENGSLRLAPGVPVDALDLRDWARRVLRGDPDVLADGPPAVAEAGELLPDFYDDWLDFERERLRELRAHALERLCDSLAARGEHGLAVLAALGAVRAEPLRESAWRSLMRVHIAEGNRARALEAFESYRTLLQDRLQLAPTPEIEELARMTRR